MEILTGLAIVGGISKNSLNRRLYGEILKHNRTKIAFQTCEIAELPFYSQDIESAPPENVENFKKIVALSDAILFITPEYNRSFPAVLKNAIDWGSRPYGKSLWNEKPAAIIRASTGKIGSFGAQQHLKNICSFLNMNLMNQPEFYLDASTAMDADGLVQSAIDFLQNYLNTFEQWILRHAKIEPIK